MDSTVRRQLSRWPHDGALRQLSAAELAALCNADNFLLLVPFITLLERLLHDCECELNWLDVVVNSKKSFCQHHDVLRASIISSSHGQIIPWTTELRYLGV